MSERITLKSPKVSAEFLPGQGGRLSSLRNSAAGFDFFEARSWSGAAAGDALHQAPPLFGADDLFPFRRGGRYPAPPYDKIEIPELGDVRGRAWRHERRGGTLRMWTADKRFGYKLEKRVSFTAPTVLRLDYRLDNVADDAMLFVWFGRVALPLHRGVRLSLPARRAWRRAAGAPLAPDPSGDAGLRERPDRLAPHAGIAWMTCEPEGGVRCEWIDDSAGQRLVVDAPAAAVPHLFVEADRGGIEPGTGGCARICLEPATGPHDGPDGLSRSPRCRLEPLQHHEWWLELSVESA